MPTPSREEVAERVAESIGRRGRDSTSLLQHLISIQSSFSFVPPDAIDALVGELGVSRTQARAAVSFYAFLHESPRGRFDILFSDNITDQLLGSRDLMARLCRCLGVDTDVPRADGRVTVGPTSCTGMCDQGPAALVNGLAVTRLDARRIDQIAGLVGSDIEPARWPAELFQVDDNIRRPGLLLSEPQMDGVGLRALIARGADAALEEIERSGLRGRGGAGFRTALKWRLCRQARGAERVVVCNADEGEPGTFKDRVLLTSYTDLVIEGMTICAGILGARRGFIYLRGEYLYLLEHLESVLARRRAQGMLGEGILGRTGFDFDMEVHLGAGAYVCGEESALIESLEGKRGVTRKRPPFPVTRGYLGHPTVVNNVETFVVAARVVERGGSWLSATGTETSKGSKILSVSGDVAEPGIYEYPFGTPVSRVLKDCGAGTPLAVQVSGAAGETLMPSELERVLAFEDVPTAGSFMVIGQDRDLLEMVGNFARFFEHESCGFCTPCRVGCSLLRELVEKVAAGQASSHDLEEMRHIGGVMRLASHCGLGQSAPGHLLQTLEKFPEIYRRRLRSGGYAPSFDLDSALSQARAIAGREQARPHAKEDP